MIEKLTPYIPAIVLAAIIPVFDFSPDKPEPIVKTEIMEKAEPASPAPVVDPLPDIPEPEPEQAQIKRVVERDNGSDSNVVQIGEHFRAILNQTHSFDSLLGQAQTEGDGLIDIHFNKYRCEHSGPLVISTKAGLPLAKALFEEFQKIYDEYGWERSYVDDVKQWSKYGLIWRGNTQGFPAVISEFGFCDDPNNPVGEMLSDPKLHKRIAEAYQAAAQKCPEVATVVLSAGHHGERGNSGAEYEGYHETTFAFDIINQIAQLPPDEPEYVASNDYSYEPPSEPDTEPEEETPVWIGPSYSPPDPRKPNEEPQPEGKWEEIPSYSEPAAAKPKAAPKPAEKPKPKTKKKTLRDFFSRSSSSSRKRSKPACKT